MIEFMNTYGLAIIGVLLIAMAGTLGRLAHKAGKAVLDTAAKKTAAQIAVRYVEQIFKDLKGPQKLKNALEVASQLLQKKGIRWDPEEMTFYIEAAVQELNEYLKPPLLTEEIADGILVPGPDPE